MRMNQRAPLRRWIMVAVACLVLGLLAAVPLLRRAASLAVVTQPAGSPLAAATFTAFHMATESAGWATTASTVLHTTDGGATWQDVTPGGQPLMLRAIHFLDAGTAWVQKARQLYRTSDGGRTWETGPTPPVSVEWPFSDRDHGWALSSDGFSQGFEPAQVWQTADGGETWQLLSETRGGVQNPGSLPLVGNKHGLGFRDANTGWAAGYQPTPGSPWFHMTHDGGRTWQPQALPMPPGHEESTVDTHPPRFFDATSGVMLVTVSGEPVAVWYVTTDGGTTWRPTAPVTGGVVAWDFTDVQHGWVLSDSKLRRTTDGGRTWEQVATGLPSEPGITMDFATPTTGWILSRAALLKSTDGGRTWRRVQVRMTVEVSRDADF